MTKTGFWWDERCFWHSGGNYAFLLPVGGLVQPQAAGGLPESPETKRRLKNLLDVTGLMRELHSGSAPEATEEELRRVHPREYLAEFKRLSDAGGGELGRRTPFGPGGYEVAALSAGLAAQALRAVLSGEQDNAYSLSRPPGHHCLPDFPNGFCLLANIAVAVEAAFAEKRAGRIAVIDWDVHHGNGTEAIFYGRDDVLTISLHQDRNYPPDTGHVEARGEGRGEGSNINVPLMPGGGHEAYLSTFRRIVLPALHRYRPDAIVVACGYDASGVDPLSRMMAGSETFAEMTRMTMDAAADLCGGRLLIVHEGGYSEAHVPFCGHAVIQTLAGSGIAAPDPLKPRLDSQQPGERFNRLQDEMIGEMAAFFGLA
ncbi:class II histone deacetylase [Lutibaculum baratangense]|uniref:Deacetylase n=1 Tax=Lutibaculum baratangense AMV1 TaxID=631454 RepID=V4RQ73_9HYPH|nr:class II histone deacetylase [Lutibaculum baratangense]ESR25335.1 Deacetylase [Lutibaculum baratangense AMV1]